jgi:hypothetical protein
VYNSATLAIDDARGNRIPMNPQEPSLAVADSAAGRIHRRRRLVMFAAGALVVSATGLAALWYFQGCGDCRPILCDNPCSLPTFGRIDDARPGAAAAQFVASLRG